MSAILLVRTTFGDAETADRVARTMIAEHLAACASLCATQSVYRWRGTVEAAEETAVLFKTTPDRAAALRARIVALHNYALPVIESWEASVDASVAEWVYEETSAR